jgi:hypothetical protein
MKHAARLSLIAASLTASWNATNVGSLQPVDWFLLLATACYVLSFRQETRLPEAPPWLITGSIAVLVVLISHEIAPLDIGYARGRYELVGYGSQVDGNGAESNLVAGVEWLAAMMLLPILVRELGNGDWRFIRNVGLAFCAGAAVSGTVAMTDLLGFTTVSESLLGYPNSSGRQAGLTSQANNVGVASAMGAPIAVWLVGRRPWIGAALLVGLASGVVASGSRGGQIGFIMACLVATLATPRARRLSPHLFGFASLCIAGAVLILPQYGVALKNLVRIGGGNASAMESDRGRLELAKQALRDLNHRTFDGVGLQVATEAHSIYLQVAAAGGLILLIGMACYFGGVVRAGWRCRSENDGLALSFAVGILIWLLVGAVENQLTDRFLYLPVGCIAALSAAEAARFGFRRTTLKKPVRVD